MTDAESLAWLRAKADRGEWWALTVRRSLGKHRFEYASDELKGQHSVSRGTLAGVLEAAKSLEAEDLQEAAP